MIALFAAALLMAAAPSAQPAAAGAPPAAADPTRTGPNHRLLSALVGRWTFAGRRPLENGSVQSFGGAFTRTALWEGRYFVLETTGGELVMPWSDGRKVAYRDMALEGFDNEKGKFVRAMIDNHFSTGIDSQEGVYDPAAKTITFTSPGGDGPRTIVRLLGPDHYVEETRLGDRLLVELDYRRAP